MCSGKPRVEQIAQQLQGSGGELSIKQLRDLGCGRAVGRYTLLRRIATGGMAEVYVARSKGISGFEKKVAIKKILPQHAHNERFNDMLVDEAKITVSLMPERRKASLIRFEISFFFSGLLMMEKDSPAGRIYDIRARPTVVS